ncbi:major facilitator superfamily domain-containing protein [Phlebopus sp. FC_14]|nr:major facilitator superfamily domain-containing protein [Phlebopus sp. FC_14]
MSEVCNPPETESTPLAWPRWLKTLVLFQVVAQVFVASWCAPAFIPAFVQLSQEMNKSITAISYLVGAYALLMGFGVLVWNPMADQFGKRPVTIVSMLIAVCASCGVASAQSYGLHKVFEGFGVCGAFSLGVGYIKDMYSPSERGRAVGVWTLGITIGPFISPLIGGFIAYYLSYRWILWLCAMLLGVLFLLQIACLPEGSPGLHSKLLSFPSLIDFAITHPGQVPPEGTITLYTTFSSSLIRTFHAARYIPVWLAGLAFVVPYCYGIVSLTNLFPVIYGEVYGFDDRAQGLLYVPLLVGSLIAEGITGRAGDWIVYGRYYGPLGSHSEVEVKNKERGMITPATPLPKLERRLIIGHAGILLSIVGFLWFGLSADRRDHWALLAVGSGVNACGVQMVTSVCFSYCVDCYPKAAKEVATVLNLFRALGSFVVLFYNQQLVANLGDGWGFGLQCFMTAFFSFGGFGLLGIFGERIRLWQA